MSRLIGVIAIALLIASGCQEPSELEVTSTSADPELEVTAISPGDSDYVSTRFDSSAVLPGDQLRFAGRLTLTRITHDNGAAMRTESFSRVLFEHRDRPVRFLGRVFGFHGIDLGTVVLQNQSMVRIAHRIPVRRILGDTTIIAGFEYVSTVNPYIPGITYEWNVSSPDSLLPFTASIETPDTISVQSPHGGTIVLRNRNLPLRWTGVGHIAIILSGIEPSGKVRPLLVVRPRRNTGSALLDARLLRALPGRFNRIVFTFVLSNRNESLTVGSYSGRILVQAASVHNTYVELQ